MRLELVRHLDVLRQVLGRHVRIMMELRTAAAITIELVVGINVGKGTSSSI